MNFALTPMVRRLLFLCTAVTVAMLILSRVQPASAAMILSYGELKPTLVAHGSVWQLFTYLFLHVDPWHLLFNMLGLYLLGISFERLWGSRSFLRFIILSGMGAGVAVCLVGWIVPAWSSPTIGLSGSLMALIAAYAVMFPEQQIMIYGVLPLKGKNLVWICAGMDVLFALAGSNVSLPAHFGGLAMGYLLVTGRWRPSKWFPKRKRKSPPPFLRVVRPNDEHTLH